MQINSLQQLRRRVRTSIGLFRSHHGLFNRKPKYRLTDTRDLEEALRFYSSLYEKQVKRLEEQSDESYIPRDFLNNCLEMIDGQKNVNCWRWQRTGRIVLGGNAVAEAKEGTLTINSISESDKTSARYVAKISRGAYGTLNQHIVDCLPPKHAVSTLAFFIT